MDPATVGGIVAGASTLIGSGINMAGAGNMNRKNRAFQERMTKEAWARDDNAIQRRMIDLEKGGINPLTAGGASGGTIQSGMANTVQGTFPDSAGNLIAQTGQQFADAENKRANTEQTITQTAWDRMSFEERLDTIHLGNEKLAWESDAIRKNIEKMAAETRSVEQSILHSKTQQDLLKEQTNTQRAETLRVMKASELITQQVKNLGKEYELTDQQINLALQEMEKNVLTMKQIEQATKKLVEDTRISKMDADWLKTDKVTGEIERILGMVLDVVGAITGRGGSKSTVHIRK